MGYAITAVVRETSTASYGEDVSAETRDDFVEDLGDEITTLAAHIHAATYRLLVLIARFDRMGGWKPGGHRSCAHWLSFNTGCDLGTARERVRVARSLEGLPLTGDAMSRGQLSFSKVRALTRVADASNEADLLDLARGATTHHLERMVRAWKRGTRQDEATLERERHQSRSLSVFPDEDGMYVVQGRLTPEVGALLMRAVEAASDALCREGGPGGGSTRRGQAGQTGHGAGQASRDAGRRRADAIGLLAERALASGFAGVDEAGTCGCPKPTVPRAERYQVFLHVDEPTLAVDGDTGTSELEDGTRVSAETSRRIACDAAVVRVHRGESGSVLDVGRRTRSIPPALRRALHVRDRGCRFPGCGSRFTEGHHVVHWADGGETSLRNTVLLCRYHHRLVHEEGWTVEWWGEGRPGFRDPRGSLHYDGKRTGQRALNARAAAVAAGSTPLAEVVAGDLIAAYRRLGIELDASTARARWKWESLIPDDVWSRAMEAF